MLHLQKMRLIIAINLLWLVSTSAQADVSIKGEIRSLDKNKHIYIYESMVNEFILMDSAIVKSGKFNFKYDNLELGRYKIGFEKNKAVEIVLGNENIKITADYENFVQTFTIDESKENSAYKEFLESEISYKNQMEKIELRARQIQNSPDRNELMEPIRKQIDSLNIWRNTYLESFSKSNSTYVNQICNYYINIGKCSKEEYFQPLSNTTLQRSNVFIFGTQNYVNRFLGNYDNNTIKAELIQAINNQKPVSKEREALCIAMITWTKNIDANFSGSVGKQYKKEYTHSKFMPEVAKTLPVLPPDIGELAPDFSLRNPKGEYMSLSALKGKVVLLDFWASWCGPCRKENPHVVKIYEKYKNAGFTIMSVSLDNSADRWKDAITKDNLSWENHVSDLQGWGSSAGKIYGVSSIPSTFLIDENGIIVAKNLRGHKLEEEIGKLLDKK